MTISLQKTGRRIYLVGDTYALRDKIKAAGGKWDPDAKAWYVGVQRKEVAEQILAAAAATPPPREEMMIMIIGRATYRDIRGYLLIWRGITKDGERMCRLAYRDGSKQFWAADTEVQVEKFYHRPLTLTQFTEFRQAATKEADNAEWGCFFCRRHCTCAERSRTGRICEIHFDGCDKCGTQHDG
jgi:hypothetical protein